MQSIFQTGLLLLYSDDANKVSLSLWPSINAYAKNCHVISNSQVLSRRVLSDTFLVSVLCLSDLKS